MSHPWGAGVSSSQYLLEVTVLSAQDLHPAGSSMRTYAKAYVDPEHRPRTRLDSTGHTDPSWNDKFVFRVDDDFLRSDTSAVTVDVYASRFGLPDVHIGNARGLMSTLRPTQVTRYVALLIRRPKSLRPQGIINVGVSLQDSRTRSLSLHPLPAAPAIAAMSKPKSKSLDWGGPGRVAVEDTEREELEKKLEKWKQELQLPRKEKRVGVNSTRDDLEGTRRLTANPGVWNGEEEPSVAGPQSPPSPIIAKEKPLRLSEQALRSAMERS